MTETNPDVEQLWAQVERARASDPDLEAVVEALGEQLTASAPDVIASFDRGLARVFERSYSWALWGAAYLINGGCSDDGFDYFRGWLVAQGRAVFEAALTNPDSLADALTGVDTDEGDCECEDILYVANDAHREQTNQDLDGESVELPALGDGWDFDDGDEMAARYPRLWAMFGWDEGDDADD